MQLPITLSEIGPRISAGAFILNSGLGKRNADEPTAAGVHGFAAGTYPFLKNVDPKQFVQGLSIAEMTVGGLLLAPFVPTAVAGAALTAFSAGLVTMYLRTPSLRKPGSIWPNQNGIGISKDIWMLGIGLGLLADAATDAVQARRRAR